MADNTKIEWATHTFNPWVGCTRISPACDHCYAESWAKRAGNPDLWNGSRRRTGAAIWRKPYQWDAEAVRTGNRPRVFCLSLGDWADAEVPPEWRRDLFDVIDACRNIDWLLLTKRHALAQKHLPASPWPHARIGMTVENQPMASIRLPRLARLAGAGWLTFVSYEPALGPVDWRPWIQSISWLIAGGESGGNARPPHPGWFRAARDACAGAGVPFLLKQWGEWAPTIGLRNTHWIDLDGLLTAVDDDPRKFGGRTGMRRVGKKAAGRTLDGVIHHEFPVPALPIPAPDGDL